MTETMVNAAAQVSTLSPPADTSAPGTNGTHESADLQHDDEGVLGELELEPQITPMRTKSPQAKESPVIAAIILDLDGEDRGRVQAAKETLFSPQLGKKHRKKKKRPIPNASPAMQTIHGFNPNDSAAEDSDASSRIATPRLGPFAGASPLIRPASPSISALKMQLDALSLGSQPGSRSVSQTRSKLGSDAASSAASTTSDQATDEEGESCTYEVELGHDFISTSVGDDDDAKSQTTLSADQKASNIYRKMTSNDFTTLKCLGKGTYGTVLLVKQNSTGRLYAQKQFRKASLTVHKKLVEQTKTERSILESVNRHPFIVNLYYAFQDKEKLYLILEYASGGELFHHLALEKFFSEDVAAFYMAEMVLALDHLHHTIGIIYRDLKPENCLLDSEGHLLLTDFGLSKVAIDDPSTPGSSRCNSQGIGTIEYMAPEVIRGDHTGYGKSCDWWSLGALGHDLLTGAPPFGGNNYTKIQENILKKKLVLPYFLSPDAKDLLTRLLRKEPNKRLGAKGPTDVAIMKKHRFFRKIDWKMLEKRELEPPIRPLITDPELAENFSAEFTALALSGQMNYAMADSRVGTSMTTGKSAAGGEELFGGFSFVASSSLLDAGLGVMD